MYWASSSHISKELYLQMLRVVSHWSSLPCVLLPRPGLVLFPSELDHLVRLTKAKAVRETILFLFVCFMFILWVDEWVCITWRTGGGQRTVCRTLFFQHMGPRNQTQTLVFRPSTKHLYPLSHLAAQKPYSQGVSRKVLESGRNNCGSALPALALLCEECRLSHFLFGK